MAIEQAGFRSVGKGPMDDAVAWAIVALAPNGILLVDEGGHIVLANQQAEEMFGYEHGELLTAEVNQLVPAQIRDQHRAHRPPGKAATRGLDHVGSVGRAHRAGR